MKSTIISLGLFKHTGGPTKTVRDFKRALDAELYSFCRHQMLKTHKLAVSDSCPVSVTMVPVFSQFHYTRKGALKAEDAVRQSDMVCCHSFYRYHALWTYKICKLAGVPYSFVPHGILDPWVMRKNRIAKRLFLNFGGQRFIEDASVLIFSTKSEQEKAASQFTFSNSEIIPWPVEPVDIVGRNEKRVQIRKELGIPEKSRVLLYFGRIHPMKRPLQTIEAFAKSNAIDIHLLIIGNEDGITKVDCMNLARRLGVEKRMHFIGPIYGDRKYDTICACDAYISLSHRENFNYTAAESLAAGLPIILSPGNDLRGELSGVGCCLNVEDDTLQSAIEAIRAFNDLSLSKLQEMSMRGRNWVKENLSFDQFKANLVSIHNRFAK